MTDPHEIELIQGAAHGDGQAFAALFEIYFRSVYNYALSLTNDPAAAEDLTQEAFIRAHKHLPAFEPPWNFRSWIFRMTHNLFLDQIRSRHREESFDEAAPIPASGPSPESRVMVHETARRVRGALQALSDKNREVLVLRELNGLSYAEIAEVLDTTQAYVKTLLARSRAQFQENYGIRLLIEEPTEDCPEVAALLYTLHDGESLEGRERFVREHLATCEACQRRRNWLVAQSGVLAAFVPVAPPAGLAERILARIGTSGSMPKPSRAGRLLQQYRNALLIGAGGTTLFVGGILVAALAWMFFGPVQPIHAPTPQATVPPAPSAMIETATIIATSTLELTSTSSPTPVPDVFEPEGELTQNANCRKGPGTAYNVMNSVLEGQTVPIDGRNAAISWWWIAAPTGGHCWISGAVIDVSGPVDGLPVVETAPPPPSNLRADVSCTSSTYSVELRWSDTAVETGYHVYRDGVRVATLGADSTSYLENLIGGAHAYALEAFNAVGASERATVNAPCP